MTEQADFLAIVDRIIGPITANQREMNGKLDRALEVIGEVKAVKEHQEAHTSRLDLIEQGAIADRLVQATAEGQRKMIAWLLGLVGAPVTVGLCVLGVAKLLGWH